MGHIGITEAKLQILPREAFMDDINDRSKSRIDPAKAAWEMFERTGNLTYYLLYKKLK